MILNKRENRKKYISNLHVYNLQFLMQIQIQQIEQCLSRFIYL